jgi:hypothetical protein
VLRIVDAAVPSRNEVHIELPSVVEQASLGVHLNGEISPTSLCDGIRLLGQQLSRFLGCQGEVAEIGSLLRGALSPEDE